MVLSPSRHVVALNRWGRSMSSRPLVNYFAEGLQAREDGKHATDNPYCAGSHERHEWDAGFRATVALEDEDGLDLDPIEDNEVPLAGR